MREITITKTYLMNHPNDIFVYGDNTLRKGMGGAASLRNFPNTYGFITKKYPDNDDRSFYTLDTYEDVFRVEMVNLIITIKSNPNKTYLISRLGAGLANKFKIFEEIIQPRIRVLLKEFKNVIYLWDD